MALKVGELFASFNLDTSGLDGAVKTAESKLDSIGSKITEIGNLWTNAFTTPIVNGMKDAVETGMTFQAAMTKAATIAQLDMNTEEGVTAYQQLEEEAFRVARQSVYSSEQVAGAYEKMAMAGWKWESMVGGLEPIMNLAAASGENVVTVSDIVTDAMTAFGLTFENAGYDIAAFQKDVEHFTDVLSMAATSSNTNVALMGESFKYAASMAGSMGYSIDDVAVALGLMANRGVKASQAGTSLRRLLTNMINPSGDAKIAIEQLGLSLEDGSGNMLSFMGVMEKMRARMGRGEDLISLSLFKQIEALNKEFYDNNDAVLKYDQAYYKGWEKFIEETDRKDYNNLWSEYDEVAKERMDPAIVEAYNAALEEQQTIIEKLIATSEAPPDLLNLVQYANALGGVRGLSAVLAIVAASEEEFNNLTEAIYGSEGRTSEMKESMLDNAMGDLQMFMSSVDILKVQIESLVNDQLRELLQGATEIIDRFISMDDETKTTILQMAGIAAAIGPALVGVGMLTKLLPALGSALSFIATPAGALVAVLGILAATALDSDGKISSALQSISDAIGIDFEMPEISAEKITGAFEGILEGIGNLSENEAVQKFMSSIGEGIRNSMSYIGNVAGALVAHILSVEGLTEIYNAGKSIVGMLWEGIQAALGGIGALFESFLLSIAEPIEEMLTQWLVDNGIIDLDYTPTVSLSDMIVDVGAFQLSDDTARQTQGVLAAALQKAVGGTDYVSSDVINNAFGFLYTATNGGVIQEWQAQFFGSILSAFRNGAEQNTETLKGLMNTWLQKAFGADYDISEYVSGDFFDLLLDVLTDPNWAEKIRSEGVMDSLLAALFAAPEQTQGAAEQAAETTMQEVMEAMERQGIVIGETADTVLSPAMTEAFAGASAEGTAAAAAAIDENTPEVEAAALAVSDAAVKAFMLLLSAENGELIGAAFTAGIAAGINAKSGDATAAAQTVGTAAQSTLASIASMSVSSIIGSNFGMGFVNGINSMQSSAATAAANLGIAAVDALSKAIKEGSPSKITEASGENFDLGLVNGIMQHMDRVSKTAGKVGTTAAETLQRSLQGVAKETGERIPGNLAGPIMEALSGSGSAAGSIGNAVGKVLGNAVSRVAQSASSDMQYIPHRDYIAPNGEHVSASNDIEPVVKRFAGVVSEALSKVGVYMDGEPVGHMVANTVSEDIARNSVIRRYATV